MPPDVEDPSDGETLVASRPVSPAIEDLFMDFHEALDDLVSYRGVVST